MPHQFRRLDRHRTENHPLHARRQYFADICRRSDAAAKLDLYIERSGDFFDYFQIDRFAGAGSIKVHDMQPFASGFDPPPRGVSRVFGKDGFPVKPSLFKANAFAAANINRRKYNHNGISLKFVKICRPTALDFSG